jgi:hypothetical protein
MFVFLLMQLRFNLRTLFLIVTLCCVSVAFIAYVVRSIVSGTRAGQHKYFLALTAHDPRIVNLSIGGYEEEFGQFDVTTVGFTIRGKPNSFVGLFVRNGETDLESLSIYQIGVLSPVILEWDNRAWAWAPRCPTLGDHSDYRPPLPWKNLSLSDVVSRYDELVAYFNEWPMNPDYRTMTSTSGTKLRYYVEPPNVNTKDSFIPGN